MFSELIFKKLHNYFVLQKLSVGKFADFLLQAIEKNVALSQECFTFLIVVNAKKLISVLINTCQTRV